MDKRARKIHNQSDPSNAGTKHLIAITYSIHPREYQPSGHRDAPYPRSNRDENVKQTSVEGVSSLLSPTHCTSRGCGWFPKRVKLGNCRVGWIEEEVLEWLQIRIDAR